MTTEDKFLKCDALVPVSLEMLTLRTPPSCHEEACAVQEAHLGKKRGLGYTALAELLGEVRSNSVSEPS